MSNNNTQPYLLYFSISKLSHFEFCPKRSKLELFKRTKEIGTGSFGAIAVGNRLHYLYSFPNKGFDRLRLRIKLNNLASLYKTRRIFYKQVDDVIVLGLYDDLRIIRDVATNKKFTALIEVKTTSKKYMWGREIKAAVKQLQLYMWVLKEKLEYLGYPLWIRSYVEIYSQRTGRLMKSIPVQYDEGIEDWIRHVVRCFRGLEKVSPPNIKICKFCPKNVKENCDWYLAMREYYGLSKS